MLVCNRRCAPGSPSPNCPVHSIPIIDITTLTGEMRMQADMLRASAQQMMVTARMLDQLADVLGVPGD